MTRQSATRGRTRLQATTNVSLSEPPAASGYERKRVTVAQTTNRRLIEPGFP
jgi:hypothetical protein